MDHDQTLMVKGELRRAIERLEAEKISLNMVAFLDLLDEIRRKAVQYRLTGLQRLAVTLEAVLPHALERGEGSAVSRSYVAAMYDALGCDDADPAMIEALMASVALRLGGQP